LAPPQLVLSLNEIADGPVLAVQKAITLAAADGDRYPALASDTCVTRLAARHGVDADQIAVGAGSVRLYEQTGTCRLPPQPRRHPCP
jgi:histidinol-phosphate aminotransferase